MGACRKLRLHLTCVRFAKTKALDSQTQSADYRESRGPQWIVFFCWSSGEFGWKRTASENQRKLNRSIWKSDEKRNVSGKNTKPNWEIGCPGVTTKQNLTLENPITRAETGLGDRGNRSYRPVRNGKFGVKWGLLNPTGKLDLSMRKKENSIDQQPDGKSDQKR